MLLLAKKKVNKFTPVPTPEPDNYQSEREVHYHHYQKPRKQQYVQRETVVIDSSDDTIGILAVIIVCILICSVVACCKCNNNNNSSNELVKIEQSNIPVEEVIKVETINKTTTNKPKVDTTITWKRYNEVINDSTTTAADYNNLLTSARKMISIAGQYGIFVQQIPKKLSMCAVRVHKVRIPNRSCFYWLKW